MNNFLRPTQLAACILISFFLVTTIAAPAQGTLNQYVRKYRKIEASQDQVKKLSRYNYLIEYFSAFSFFKPKHKVNPDFVRSLILAESNADPKARSGKDARGLTQIIYPTGKQAARELAAKGINFRHVSKRKLLNLKPDDLYNPAINILLACYLIAKYNYHFKGKLDLVVSAWNAGANSIVNNKPPNYKETLNLIGKVNGYFVYFLQRKQGKVTYAYRR
ncbi:MAG: transglycosylase SLT domain-containing protein [Desulfobulbaceae bacterium]|nr:transglycosylase SLT domain-containing protein [Desulfobulbaceae bacterium]